MANKQEAPHGYNSMTPYITAGDADTFLKFIRTVFEASTIMENRYDDGSLQHARMVIGDSLLMINQSNEEYSENESQLHVYVEDVGKAYTAALDAGATSLMEPNLRPHGDLMAGFRDPCGNRWWVASPNI